MKERMRNTPMFDEWLKKHRLKRTQRSCDLWNTAYRAGWEARRSTDLAVIAGYSAPINSIINGDQCAREIYDALNR